MLSRPIRFRIIAAVGALVIICFHQTGASSLRQPAWEKVILTGHIEHPMIKEASGIIASHHNKGVFWIHNDGGNGPFLFAVTGTGEHKGKFQIADAVNIDWEDIALFYHKGVAYLLIADVGDNKARRNNCVLYTVAEPMLSPSGSERMRALQTVWQQRFEYEDGPKDCEAVAVDIHSRKILLVSKREDPPVLYALPLVPERTGQVEIAKRISAISSIPPPTRADLNFKYGKYRSQPTAMDLSPSGQEMVILTYKNAYSYKHLIGEDWKVSLSRPPEIVYLPPAETTKLYQREALCFGSNGRTLFVTSEGQFAPIYRLNRKDY